jgi:uncharacterized protein DUF4337
MMMEANEAQELQEHNEHAGGDKSLRPVAFAMSILAVLVAITTVLGHRSHTEAVLEQSRASDQWNLYQAKKIRQSDTSLAVDMLKALPTRDADSTQKLIGTYQQHIDKWNDDLNEELKKAQEFENEVKLEERRANRFDLGEALLEIGLVVTSITLLTRRRSYSWFGGVFGLFGILMAIRALTLR